MTTQAQQNPARNAEQLAHHLVVALVNLDMHAPEHSLVVETLDDVVTEVEAICNLTHQDSVRISTIGDRLCWGDHELRCASLQAGRLLRLCHERNIAAITITNRVTNDELGRFLDLLSDRIELAAFTTGLAATQMTRLGIDNVQIDQRDAQTQARIRSDSAVLRQYQAMADVLHTSHVAAFRGDLFAVDAAAGVIEGAISSLDSEPSDLLGLALDDDIDQFTVGHSIRVTLLALHVAQAMGASRQNLMRLGTAALLHDIGKSRVPQDILFKQGRLDPEERQIMAQHARWGGELLLEHGGVDLAAVGAAFCHHMGPGGRGYPERAELLQPSGISKLVRVCDVFEALTSVRPYKPALNPMHAYVIMNRMREGFDPRWLRYFMRCIGLYPIGTHLVLDSGEEAIVVGRGASMHQPEIAVVADADGNTPQTDSPTHFTVGVPTEGRTRQIHAVVGASAATELPADLVPKEGHEHGESCGCDIGRVDSDQPS